jgi:hypothetical protein
MPSLAGLTSGSLYDDDVLEGMNVSSKAPINIRPNTPNLQPITEAEYMPGPAPDISDIKMSPQDIAMLTGTLPSKRIVEERVIVKEAKKVDRDLPALIEEFSVLVGKAKSVLAEITCVGGLGVNMAPQPKPKKVKKTPDKEEEKRKARKKLLSKYVQR